MSAMDKMTITILPDGTIKTVTDPISGPNHSSAEKFVSGIEELAGGPSTHEHRHDGEHHHNYHTHDEFEEQH